MPFSTSTEAAASRPLSRYVLPAVEKRANTDGQYEAELERVIELRKASLSTFMQSVRSDIEGLWLDLMMSDEEKDAFVGFIDGQSGSL